MSVSGHIIGGPADPDYDGAVLTADLAIGDTVLQVDDVADFDEDAVERDATLILGLELNTDGDLDLTTGTALAYTTCDDDASTVTLAAPSTVAAPSGDRVYIEDPVSGDPVGRVEVLVSVDNADTTGDALTAYIDVALLESVGDVDLNDLAVDLDEDEDGQLFVSGFPGLVRRQGRIRGKATDTHTVSAAGDLTMQLTYRPIPETEHLRWCGASQPFDSFTRNGWAVTIADPDSAVEVGDVFTMQYLYTDPTPRPPVPAGAVLIGSSIHDNIEPQTIDLPAGTEPGDLILVAAGTGGLDGDMPFIVDSRLALERWSSDDHDYVAMLVADGSGAPVIVELNDGEGNGSVVLAVYRITGTYSTMSSRDDLPYGVPGVDPAFGLMVLAADGTAEVDPNRGWSQEVFDHGSSTYQEVRRSDGSYDGYDMASTTWAMLMIGVMDG